MLFHSHDFIFGLLPLTWSLWRAADRRSPRAALWVLVLASLVFYAWWYPPYLVLFLASMLGNFGLGQVLGDDARAERVRDRALWWGIAANLSLLFVYKYLGWVLEILGQVGGPQLQGPGWSLPIGISFFTFQQVAYLVDARRGLCKEHDGLAYAFFVSFFPQLIAGPIIHHRDILPQVHERRRPTADDLAVGVSLFVVGLAKKVLIADVMAPQVDRVFGGVHAGEAPTTAIAWLGMFAWHFQLYFDFSGYSDMSLGLARMFAMRLPVNFEAPYRSDSLTEFWRRWHLSLSHFLRDYLYVPLGGNKGGPWMQARNQFLTLFVAAVWHGAGWTFVVWGLQMGGIVYVHTLLRDRGWTLPDTPFGVGLGRALLWLCMLSSWPLFRGQSLTDAGLLYEAMLGIGPAGLGAFPLTWLLAFTALTVWTQVLPTTQQLFRHHDPAWRWRPIDRLTGPAWLAWHPTWVWGACVAGLFAASVTVLDRAGAFLYWNF